MNDSYRHLRCLEPESSLCDALYVQFESGQNASVVFGVRMAATLGREVTGRGTRDFWELLVMLRVLIRAPATRAGCPGRSLSGCTRVVCALFCVYVCNSSRKGFLENAKFALDLVPCRNLFRPITCHLNDLFLRPFPGTAL